MKLKNWKLKLAVFLSLLLLMASSTVPNAFAFTESISKYSKNGISIDIKKINEVAKTTFIDGDGRNMPTQNLAQMVAMIVQLDTMSKGTPEYYLGTDVLNIYILKIPTHNLRVNLSLANKQYNGSTLSVIVLI